MERRHILFTQVIFAPDEARFIRNLNSITSLALYLEKYPLPENLHITFAFGGCPMNCEYWDILCDTIKDLLKDKTHFVYRYDYNYGKAYIINDIAFKKLPHYDYDTILSVDSDIVFDIKNPDVFSRLYNCIPVVEELKHKPFGVIALNQYEQNCHMQKCFDNLHKFGNITGDKTYDERIVWPNEPSGIAGGCLFLNRKMFDAVGGYRVMGVYAGDDAYILIDSNNNGFSYQLAHSISIIHPFEDDAEYIKWKNTVCQRDSYSGRKEDISKQVHESHDFWKQRIKDHGSKQ